MWVVVVAKKVKWHKYMEEVFDLYILEAGFLILISLPTSILQMESKETKHRGLWKKVLLKG